MSRDVSAVSQQQFVQGAVGIERRQVKWYTWVVSWWKHTISPYFSVVSRALELQEKALREQDPNTRIGILRRLHHLAQTERSSIKKEKIEQIFRDVIVGLGARAQPGDLGEFATEYGRLLAVGAPEEDSLKLLVDHIEDVFRRYPEAPAGLILQGFIETISPAKRPQVESILEKRKRYFDIVRSDKKPEDKVRELLELRKSLYEIDPALWDVFSDSVCTSLPDAAGLVQMVSRVGKSVDCPEPQTQLFQLLQLREGFRSPQEKAYFQKCLDFLGDDSKVRQSMTVMMEMFDLIKSEKDPAEKMSTLIRLQKELKKIDPELEAVCLKDLSDTPEIREKTISLLSKGEGTLELYFSLACLFPEQAVAFQRLAKGVFASCNCPAGLVKMVEELISKVDKAGSLEDGEKRLKHAQDVVGACLRLFHGSVPEAITKELERIGVQVKATVEDINELRETLKWRDSSDGVQILKRLYDQGRLSWLSLTKEEQRLLADALASFGEQEIEELSTMEFFYKYSGLIVHSFQYLFSDPGVSEYAKRKFDSCTVFAAMQKTERELSESGHEQKFDIQFQTRRVPFHDAMVLKYCEEEGLTAEEQRLVTEWGGYFENPELLCTDLFRSGADCALLDGKAVCRDVSKEKTLYSRCLFAQRLFERLPIEYRNESSKHKIAKLLEGATLNYNPAAILPTNIYGVFGSVSVPSVALFERAKFVPEFFIDGRSIRVRMVSQFDLRSTIIPEQVLANQTHVAEVSIPLDTSSDELSVTYQTLGSRSPLEVVLMRLSELREVPDKQLIYLELALQLHPELRENGQIRDMHNRLMRPLQLEPDGEQAHGR